MKTPRRTALTLLAGIAALAGATVLSGCATFDDADVVARVGDRTLTDDDVNAVANSPIAQGAVIGGTLDGEVARNIVTVWVRNAALADAPFLAAVDLDDLRARLTAELGEAFTASDPFTQQLLIDNAAVSTAIQDGVISDADAFALVGAVEVEVDARYGTWDDERLEVVALGS